MRSFYAQFWPLHQSASLRRAIIVSIILHVVIVSALTVRLPRKLQLTQAGMYAVDLVNPSAPPADAPPLGKPMVAPPVKPQPAPPPPPPKADEPKPKAPEPKKDEPKPVKLVKDEKPKEEKPKKETAKEERKKEKEEEKKKPEDKPVKLAKNDNPLNDVADNPLDDLRSSNQPTRPTRKQTPVPGVETGKQGLTMAGGVPSVLGMWGGLVQRKVEKEWTIPEGIQLGPADDGALISFWVDRGGKLVGEPEVVKQAADPAVATSAILAIKSAVPYPALPDSFGDAQVQVYYTFIPLR